MLRQILLSLALCTGVMTAHSQPPGQWQKPAKSYRYRVELTDKKHNAYSLKHPEKYLSQKAIERRKRYGLTVDEHDLPLTDKYVYSVLRPGVLLHNKSKWNNTLVVEVRDTTLMDEIGQLPCVKGVKRVWEQRDSIFVLDLSKRAELVTNKRDTTIADYYGYGAAQVRMLGADRLHEEGCRGKGVTIAVLDGGFLNADLIQGLPHDRILGTRHFAHPGKSVYADGTHGTMVLSCIAANEPHFLVGTAPEASFYLLQSEDAESEQLVEEDNWAAALEYADSLGCDIATSSLGYYQFDHAYMNHTYRELDGRTALISRTASLAASRGMLLLNSAGNSGDDTWKKIGFPADACDMIAVGAVTPRCVNTHFSSLGDAADHRTKPDLMAMGQRSSVYNFDGEHALANGTSFSCPTLCGAVALLVQKFPNRRPTELIEALIRTADNAEHPDNIFGYGIPDMKKASDWLESHSK